eukprot:2371729-Pyramimonas_sp.AAC.1
MATDTSASWSLVAAPSPRDEGHRGPVLHHYPRAVAHSRRRAARSWGRGGQEGGGGRSLRCE